MNLDEETRKEYEQALDALLKNQKEEMKKKTNPLFAKMHAMSDEEAEELKDELEKAHEMQRRDLARKYGADPGAPPA